MKFNCSFRSRKWLVIMAAVLAIAWLSLRRPSPGAPSPVRTACQSPQSHSLVHQHSQSLGVSGGAAMSQAKKYPLPTRSQPSLERVLEWADLEYNLLRPPEELKAVNWAGERILGTRIQALESDNLISFLTEYPYSSHEVMGVMYRGDYTEVHLLIYGHSKDSDNGETSMKLVIKSDGLEHGPYISVDQVLKWANLPQELAVDPAGIEVGEADGKTTFGDMVMVENGAALKEFLSDHGYSRHEVIRVDHRDGDSATELVIQIIGKDGETMQLEFYADGHVMGQG
jgi:hypothetical protein